MSGQLKPLITKRNLKFKKMKKNFILLIMMLGINILSLNANNIKFSTFNFDNVSNETNDAPLLYDMHINNHINGVKRSFYLDDIQEKLIYNVQQKVENVFNDLNEITDVDEKERRINNIMNYWKCAAHTSFYITERADAEKMFRRYWACVNITMKNKGYMNETGELIIK